MKTHVFLDLEDTVIHPVSTGWWNTAMLDVSEIKRWLKAHDPDTVNIFSFALWNQDELDKFNNSFTRNMLENELEVKLSLIPTVDREIIPACCDVLGLNKHTVSFQDAVAFWGKHEAFRLFTRFVFRNTEEELKVVLFDDWAINEHWNWPDLKISGQIIKV
jgi:hypothetical protein